MVNLFQEHAAAVILTALGLIVWIVCALVLQAGTISIISDSYLGKEPTVGSRCDSAGENFPLLLVAFSKD